MHQPIRTFTETGWLPIWCDDSDEEIHQRRREEETESEDALSSSNEDEETEDEDDEDTSSNSSEDTDEGNAWKKEDIHPPHHLLESSLGPCVSQGSAIDYFTKYFSQETVKKIALETNTYAFAKFGKLPRITEDEIEKFMGLCLYFGIYQLPRTRIAWMTGCAITVISEVLSRDRFEEIRRYLHFLAPEKAINNADRLCKVRLFTEPILEAMKNIPQSNVYSLDEQMVSFKGRTILRQYMPAKPTRWGIKIFFLCAHSGLMHKFIIYDGKNHFEENFTSGLVLQLCQDLPPGSQVYFDNYFSSLSVVERLRLKNIYVVATMRSNRCRDVANLLETEETLKMHGRGSMDWRTNATNDTIIIRWFDNRAVLLCSTYCGIGQPQTITRWNRNTRAHIEVPVPQVVKAYNIWAGLTLWIPYSRCTK
jgi:hypothetical protein